MGGRAPGLPLPGVRGRGAGGRGQRAGSGVDRGGGGRMHRVKVKVVEDALDANETIARANRDDFDRAGVTVVNFMGAPGAGKTTMLEGVLDGLRAGVLEGDVQGSLDADRLASLHFPVVQWQAWRCSGV